MSTAGANSGAIATDRGAGTINMSGGSVTTSGADSPGIYSTGNTVYYNPSACPDLGGKTYSLNGGGQMVPVE